MKIYQLLWARTQKWLQPIIVQKEKWLLNLKYTIDLENLNDPQKKNRELKTLLLLTEDWVKVSASWPKRNVLRAQELVPVSLFPFQKPRTMVIIYLEVSTREQVNPWPQSNKF